MITTPLSFFATAGAIARARRAAGVRRHRRRARFNLDPARRSAPRHRAHARDHAGAPVRARRATLEPLAAPTGIAVIEDAAQAIGAEHAAGARHRSATRLLSFFPSKNLGAAGDAGAVVSDDARSPIACA